MSEQSIECPTCEKLFLSDETVVNHYIKKHQCPNSTRRPYRCSECEDWLIRAPYNTGENTFCSTSCRGEFQSRRMSGENHHNWKGGISTRGRRWQLVSWHVRQRDGGCRICGRKRSQSGNRLHVHHIVPEKDVLDDLNPHVPANLVSLCRSCHKKVEGEPVKHQLTAYSANSLRELAFSKSRRADVNETIDEDFPSRYQTFTKQMSDEFIEKYDIQQYSLRDFIEQNPAD